MDGWTIISITSNVLEFCCYILGHAPYQSLIESVLRKKSNPGVKVSTHMFLLFVDFSDALQGGQSVA